VFYKLSGHRINELRVQLVEARVGRFNRGLGRGSDVGLLARHRNIAEENIATLSVVAPKSGKRSSLSRIVCR